MLQSTHNDLVPFWILKVALVWSTTRAHVKLCTTYILDIVISSGARVGYV